MIEAAELCSDAQVLDSKVFKGPAFLWSLSCEQLGEVSSPVLVGAAPVPTVSSLAISSSRFFSCLCDDLIAQKRDVEVTPFVSSLVTPCHGCWRLTVTELVPRGRCAGVAWQAASEVSSVGDAASSGLKSTGFGERKVCPEALLLYLLVVGSWANHWAPLSLSFSHLKQESMIPVLPFLSGLLWKSNTLTLERVLCEL